VINHVAQDILEQPNKDTIEAMTKEGQTGMKAKNNGISEGR